MKFEIEERPQLGWHVKEYYLPYILSIVAGVWCISKPVIYLPSIEQYELVEIAIMCDGDFVSKDFLTQFDFFYNDVVAGQVNWNQVNIVRRRLELLSCS